MKKLFLLLLLPLLASCYVKAPVSEEKQPEILPPEIISTGSIDVEVTIPPHEKTTSVEEEFSQDLKWLLDLIDEEPNE